MSLATRLTDLITAVGADINALNTRVFSGPRVVAATSSSSVTINADVTDLYKLTALAAAVTFNAPTGTAVDGQKLLVRIKDNATARAITWNAIFLASPIGTLPTTTVISKTHLIGFIYDSANTKWVCVGADSAGY